MPTLSTTKECIEEQVCNRGINDLATPESYVRHFEDACDLLDIDLNYLGHDESAALHADDDAEQVRLFELADDLAETLALESKASADPTNPEDAAAIELAAIGTARRVTEDRPRLVAAVIAAVDEHKWRAQNVADRLGVSLVTVQTLLSEGRCEVVDGERVARRGL